ncbi:MAG: DNA internalization-related competence protein ComEC/Rec2 [Ideonella sp.]
MFATVSGSRSATATVRSLRAGPVASWILVACLAWLLGVGAQLLQPELDDVALLQSRLWLGLGALAVALAAASGALHFGSSSAINAQLRWTFVFLASIGAIAVAGWSSTGLLAHHRLSQRLSAALEGVDLLVTGIVSDLPQVGPDGLRFQFDPESATLDGRPHQLPPRLILGWYAGREEGAIADPAMASLRAGQRWRLTLRLRRPHGNLNPHGYDFELHLFERNQGATGYVRAGPQGALKLSDNAGFALARFRQSVRDSIQRHVDDRRSAGVLAALVVGDQAAIDRGDWQLFRDTGIAHLVAISGLHITMFSWLAAGLIGAAWRRSERAPLWLAAPHASRWGGLVAAAGYAVFSGWGVPAQRTLAMLALVVVLHSIGRRWPWPLILLTAAVLVTAVDPWAMLQPGFWLSFVAVGLLLASDAVRHVPAKPVAVATRWGAVWRHAGGSLGQMLRSQGGVSIGLAPLSMIFFQQVSLVGLLANLLAIPLVTLLITPLAMLGIALPWLWQPAAWLLQLMSSVLAWLASWPLAVWTVPAAPVWAQLSAMLGALLAVLPIPWRLRLLVLPLALPLLLPARTWPLEGRFEAMAVDVGQGTSVLIRTRTRLLVYDAGPRYARDSDAGERVLLPLLRGRGEDRVDMLVLSHRDSDHVGGASSLMRGLPVDELLASLETGHPLWHSKSFNRRCVAGQRWVWDGVQFEILHPLVSDDPGGNKPNAISCVLRVAGSAPGSGSLLVTGDVERLQELALVSRDAERLRSTVIIVPHHGSRTSSTAQLLDAVQPRLAVFQAGYRNRFGHPAADVVARYRSRGIAVVESTGCGAWTWQGDAEVTDASCERQLRRRHWHASP